MIDKIELGSRVEVEITNRPTNAAARKTLERVLGKDRAVIKEDKRMTRVRKQNYQPRPRGGRLYGGHMGRVTLVEPVVGARGTVTATASVINDLRSVARFVQVKAG